MKKISRSQFLQISIMLFGLFFGAGNLIFPPLLGNQAGTKTWVALLSFSVTAVLFPVLAAITVSKTDGLQNLGNRVGKVFSIVFTTAIYLAIGPGMGIPRAGSVPFEMAVAPYVPESFSMMSARLIYTALFFIFAMWICLNPSKLVKRVGKVLTPMLLVLIAIMFIKVITIPHDTAAPIGEYKNSPVVQGFLAGYDTMDAIAGLNFGFVVTLAIMNFGVTNKKSVVNYTIKAGVLAGAVLFIVYAMLSAIGMVTSTMFAGAENGAIILTESVKLVFGNFGVVLLAAIFTLACLTTCVGLITSGSEYFHSLFKEKLSYKSWVIIWTIFSFLMANFGLNKLLKISVPMLIVIYPSALVLTVMGITDDYFKYSKLSYVVASTISVVLPFLYMLRKVVGINLPLVTKFESELFLAEHGLSWLLPSVIAVLLLKAFDMLFAKKK